MTDGYAEDKGNKPSEIRLALVLNGGISLAVWMGGVARELDLLRRASRRPSGSGSEDSVDEQDQEVFGYWRELTRGRNQRVLIDVIAGTSAGGINGMLLATAIGRGAALPDLKATWQKAAALNNLLGQAPGQSLMQGEVIETTVDEVIRELNENTDLAEPITLFLTATALDGQPQKYVDGYGSEFDVRDHRRIYRFQHDANHLNYQLDATGKWTVQNAALWDFSNGVSDRTLLLAARATASFPVAFTPVDEDPMRARRHRQRRIPSSCVLDGGILNNEPFEPVLEAISERRLDGHVERVLVYVVPSSSRVEQEKIGRLTCGEIPWTDTAMASLSYPRESNFRSATESLDARLRNSDGDAQDDLFRRMQQQSELGHRLLDQASCLIGEYRRRRAISVVWDARRRMAGSSTVKPLVTAHPENADKVIGLLSEYLPDDRKQSVTAPSFSSWKWGLYPTERVIRLLAVDIEWRLEEDEKARKHRIACGGPACGDGRHRIGYSQEQRDRLGTAATQLGELLRSTLAVMGAVWTKLGQQVQAPLSDAWVADRSSHILRDLCVSQTLGGFVKEAAERYFRAVSGLNDARWDSAGQVISYCLAVEVLVHAFAPASKIVESVLPTFGFLRLNPDELGPLFDKDPYTGLGIRKLYGVRFNHFGAFAEKSWRASDYTWGRLDAAHHLLRILIPDCEQEREQAEREIHDAILKAEKTTREEVEKNLRKLKDSSDAALLKEIVMNDGTALPGVAGSLLKLLRNPGPANGTPPHESRTEQCLHAAEPFLSAVFSQGRPARPKRQRWRLRLLRHLTGNTRKRLYEDPTALRTAVLRDRSRLRWYLYAAATVCVLLVGWAVASAILLLP